MCCASLVMCALPEVPSPAGQRKSNGSISEQFIGAWRLVSIEMLRANSEVIYPFYGKHPEGMIMYDRSGWTQARLAASSGPPILTTGTPSDGKLFI
jgi:hypothetical protein